MLERGTQLSPYSDDKVEPRKLIIVNEIGCTVRFPSTPSFTLTLYSFTSILFSQTPQFTKSRSINGWILEVLCT